MKKRKFLRWMLLCTVLLLCVVMCTACGGGGDLPKMEDYFSKEEIQSWEKENKKYKQAMNGGYFLYFQGEYYPLDFNNGIIFWACTPPDELFFIDMDELFTDPELTNRCCYQGWYTISTLFQSDEDYPGYILDGKRPANGSVLYLDESKERVFSFGYNSAQFGPDDQLIFHGASGKIRDNYACYSGSLVYCLESGYFREELSTIRKIYQYAKEKGVLFDSVTKYSGIPYPSCYFGQSSGRGENDSLIEEFYLRFDDVPYSGSIGLYFRYGSEVHQDQYYRLVLKPSAVANVQEYYPQHGSNLVYDELGRIIECYDTESGIKIRFLYSPEELENVLENTYVVDPESKQAVAYYSLNKEGEQFDVYEDYYQLVRNNLYAVWKDCKIVALHDGSDETVIGVVEGKEVTLPDVRRPGYTFAGWYADESYSGQPITKVTYANNYENLYAKFNKVDFYTLTFEPFEGESFDAIQYAYGDMVQLPTLKKPFYIFKGWCKDEACATKPIKFIRSDFYGDYHLYPYFEAREYTVTLKIGEVATDVEVRYGEMYTLPIGSVEAGFVGYFDQDGVQYTDENGNSLAPFTDGADIQLVPHYQ